MDRGGGRGVQKSYTRTDVTLYEITRKVRMLPVTLQDQTKELQRIVL